MANAIIVNSDNRPRNIAIGCLVVSILTYWQFTGSLPLLAESMVPIPSDGKVSSAWSFGVELLGDALYFVGIAATGFASGIWSLVLGLINLVVGKVNAKPSKSEAVTRELLDHRTEQVFSAIEKPLNDLSATIDQLGEQIAFLSHPSEIAKPAVKRRSATAKPAQRKDTKS